MAVTERQTEEAKLPLALREGRCRLRFAFIGWFEEACERQLGHVDISHTLVPPPGA